MPVESHQGDTPDAGGAVIGEVLPAQGAGVEGAAGGPSVTIINVFIQVAQGTDVRRLLGAGRDDSEGEDDESDEDEDEDQDEDEDDEDDEDDDEEDDDGDDEVDDEDEDAAAVSALEGVGKATGRAWRAPLRAALEAGKRRPRTPPSVLMEQYRRLEVEAFDGAKLVVRPAAIECLTPSESSREGEGRGARAEAALRELLKAIRAERDLKASSLFRRVFGRAVGAVREEDLGFLRAVFRGLAAPWEVSNALALVDRYHGPSPLSERWEREAALSEFFRDFLGLAPEGFALSYVRALKGSAAFEVVPGAARVTTDDLSVGDLVWWSPSQVAVVDRVFNLLSTATRVEVVEVRPDAAEGLGRATWQVRAGDLRGTFRLSGRDGRAGVARITAPV